MENLSVDDLKQLLTFYKQKCTELEFSLLTTQLNLNKLAVFKKTILDQAAAKSFMAPPISADEPLKVRSSGQYVPTSIKNKDNKLAIPDKTKTGFFKKMTKSKKNIKEN